MRFFVGTAGWTVPKQHDSLFHDPSGAGGTHLARYAKRLQCVEVNSSFYRPHRRATWERWAASTPPGFAFSVKAPKTITHTARLADTGALLCEFFESVSGLGEKLGPVLFQLPPSLAFNDRLAAEFFTELRTLYTGAVALEPRHASWFTAPVEQLLQSYKVARVAADPPAGSPHAALPAGWPQLRYWRLHGAPRTYYSEYTEAWLRSFAQSMQPTVANAGETWVVFDNTALGHAAANAVHLDDALRHTGPGMHR